MSINPKPLTAAPLSDADVGDAGISADPLTAGTLSPTTLDEASTVPTTLTASPLTGISTQAEQWFSAAGPPDPALGVTGDWYLDSVTGDYYEKTSGSAWTYRGNLMGPEGPVGPEGELTVFEQPDAPTEPVEVGAIWIDTDELPPGGSTGGGGSDANYVHTQSTLSSSWVVFHNLHKYASIEVVDSGGNTVLPDVHYNNSDQITLTFAAPTSGVAYIN